MRSIMYSGALILSVASLGISQQPDSLQRADSAQRADSIALEKELGRIRNEPGNRTPTRPSLEVPRQGGSTNPRLLPDISAVGDFVGDFSPKGSTQEDGTRFGVREVEIAVQAAVDPYFRGDVFLGISDAEGIAIEQAYLTTTALPWGLEVRGGRFLMPFGKQNTTHRHDLHTVEFPWMIQSLWGPEGLKGTGLYVSRVFSPFGFYQELIATAVDRLGENEDGLLTEEPVNKKLSGMGYSTRLRNYWDVSEATNFELSASAITGVREQAVDCSVVTCAPGTDAVNARQTTFGADLTFRWRPLERGLYRSFILQAEYQQQHNAAPAQSDLAGAYAFARYQLTQRLFLGARVDNVGVKLLDDDSYSAASTYLEFFPSEFSKLVAAFERTMPYEEAAVNRILVQATFALGPHKPHPF